MPEIPEPIAAVLKMLAAAGELVQQSEDRLLAMVVDLPDQGPPDEPPEDSPYYLFGMREGYTHVARTINRWGLAKGVKLILETLKRMEPEHPHVEPALKRIEELEGDPS